VTAPVHLDAIAGRFALAGPIIWIESLRGGHINDSYRVLARRPDGVEVPYLLQHVNPTVFPDAVRVMENIAYVTRHLAAHRRARHTTREALSLVPTISGAAWMEDAARSCWRAYGFIAGTHVKERADRPPEAYEAGLAFGEFLRLLSDYDGPELHVTIDGFHDTAARFAQLEDAATKDPVNRRAAVEDELEALRSHRKLADVLPPLFANGTLPTRVVHNDAKIANVLLDDVTGQARCVVDLDTVMPGSLLHDFGDMVRSMTTPTDEDDTDLGNVGVQPDLFDALARGFLEGVGEVLLPAERELLVLSGRLITLEQSVRFLTDYLNGDRYYRDTRGDQNLRRARAQLAMYLSLTQRQRELEAIIQSIR
jgi:aminoglycoside phosphotransferase (APT) family kinase protein